MSPTFARGPTDALRAVSGGRAVDPLIGQVVDGRYLIEGALGEGGMGLVYRARHTVLGKPLAMKVLRTDVSRDEEIITRFRQEAQSASSIGNQHIIDISDFGALRDGSTYFVMEMLDGFELSKAIERGAMRFPEIVHVAKQLTKEGVVRDAALTPRELAARMEQRSEPGAAQVAELTELYYAAEWGQHRDPAAEDRASTLALEIREHLAAAKRARRN